MTLNRARAYSRLRQLVHQFEDDQAERIVRAANTLLFARTWRDPEVVAAIADIRDLAADGQTEDIARVVDLLEAVAPADLQDRGAVAA